VEGMPVSGILVKRNFNYHILAPADLPKYTDLTMSTVTQVSELFSVLPTLGITFRPFFRKTPVKIRQRIFLPFKIPWSNTGASQQNQGYIRLERQYCAELHIFSLHFHASVRFLEFNEFSERMIFY
jgi:hypothetical protein